MEPSLRALLPTTRVTPRLAAGISGFGALTESTFEAGEPVAFAGDGTIGVPFRQLHAVRAGGDLRAS
jgi:hypothetical protein